MSRTGSYKWLVLVLSALTFTCVVAIPQMSLPVLFDEISTELDLDIVQVGWIWGIGSVLGILVGLVGGPLGDRFGPRRTLAAACVLMGIAGAARGLSHSFTTLAVTSLMTGFGQWLIPMNVHKTCGVWFPSRQLGMANGIVSLGMAFGFLLGSLLAATYFSPLLGGWRKVLIAYGVLAVCFGVFWCLTRENTDRLNQQSTEPVTFYRAIAQVVRSRNVWIFCLATAGVSGCVNGMLGYLPLYLRGLNWEPSIADGAMASFHAASLLFAIPITLLSDRLGSRRRILMVAALSIGFGTFLLGIATGVFISIAVLIAGLSRDGFMATTMTAIIEIKRIGVRYAGTAIGLNMSLIGIANVLAPPTGNWLSKFGPGFPFIFWASLAFCSTTGYFLVKKPS